MHGIISLLAGIIILLSLKRGLALSVFAAILNFVALIMTLFKLSGDFNIVDCFVLFIVAFALFCDGVIIGLKKRPWDGRVEHGK